MQTKLLNYLDLLPVKGDVGIEIEMETKNSTTFSDSILKDWRIEHDGSLKNWGYELVVRNPQKFDAVEPLLKQTQQSLDDQGTKILDVIRAGVHIHLNLQQYTIPQLYYFLSVYYPLETVLARYCGEGRSGNLFCLRARDAEYLIDLVTRSVVHDDLYMLKTDSIRYSALNLRSLFNYGTVEFRALRTPKDVTKITEWVRIIEALKKYCDKGGKPWSLVEEISANGPRLFLYKVFGEELGKILDYPELENDIMFDLQNTQMLFHELRMKDI